MDPHVQLRLYRGHRTTCMSSTCGNGSGWMYQVNDWFPNYGCSRYQLQDGRRDVSGSIPATWARTWAAAHGRCQSESWKEPDGSGRDSLFRAIIPPVNLLCFSPWCWRITMCLHAPGVAWPSPWLGAACYYVRLLGAARPWRGMLLGVLPVMLLAAVVNPAFNHAGGHHPHLSALRQPPDAGEHPLWPGGGGHAVRPWCCGSSCFNAVMTSDKFVYLFGRVDPGPVPGAEHDPALRAPVPAASWRLVVQAQRCVGPGRLQRQPLAAGPTRAVTIFSIMVTWALENAIETADSMKSRGYGLPGPDGLLHLPAGRAGTGACWRWLGFCGAYLLCGWPGGGLKWRYYPTCCGGVSDPPLDRSAFIWRIWPCA